MEDVILVSGVLYLRPPSDEGEEDGILCDGIIEFRPPTGRKTGVTPYKKQFGVIPAPEPEDDGTMIDVVPGADEGQTFDDEGSMG